MGDRLTQSNKNRKVVYIDVNKLYGWAMSQFLPWKEIPFNTPITLREILEQMTMQKQFTFSMLIWNIQMNLKTKPITFPAVPSSQCHQL